MKTSYLGLISLLGLAVTTAQAGTHVGIGLSFGVPAPVVVHRAPPAQVVETVSAAPAAGYVWLPGHYSWAGDHWAWMAGAWVLPPRSDARWVDGVWNPQNQQWIEGHWEVPTTSVAMPPAPPVAMANEIVVAEAPPPPAEVVVRTASPGPGYVWIDGYWGWENGHRAWYRGHWEHPPHGYHAWVAPRWDHSPHGYVFVRGYWR